MRRTFLAVFAVLLAAAPAHARPGDLDRSFANGGRIALPLDYGTVSGLALSDGTRPVLGVFPRRFGYLGHELLLTAGGKLARATALQPPVIGQSQYRSGFVLTPINPAPLQLRLVPVDPGAAVTLTLPDPPRLIAFAGVDRAGRSVLVAGTVGSRTRSVAVRFLPDGSLDTSYGESGRVASGTGSSAPSSPARATSTWYAKPARSGACSRSTAPAGRARLHGDHHEDRTVRAAQRAPGDHRGPRRTRHRGRVRVQPGRMGRARASQRADRSPVRDARAAHARALRPRGGRAGPAWPDRPRRVEQVSGVGRTAHLARPRRCQVRPPGDRGQAAGHALRRAARRVGGELRRDRPPRPDRDRRPAHDEEYAIRGDNGTPYGAVARCRADGRILAA